jgi:integrase
MRSAPSQLKRGGVARPLATALIDGSISFDRSAWNLKPTTKHGYRKSRKRFDRWFDDAVGRPATLGDIFNPDNVNAYLADHADRPTMSRNDVIAFHALSKWAVATHIVPKDPLAGVALPRGRGTKRKPFADADVPAIIKAAAESGLGTRDRAIIILALSAALRPAEMVALQLSDVNLSDGWLNVRIETTKTDAGERTIPLDPQAIDSLDEYINDMRGTTEGALFLTMASQPFTYLGFMSMHYRLRDRLRKQGIKYEPYRMRHTGITNWARTGLSATTLKELAGHQSIATTQRYVGRMSKKDLSRLPHAFTAMYGRIAR